MGMEKERGERKSQLTLGLHGYLGILVRQKTRKI
jgi:hypothetical protein